MQVSLEEGVEAEVTLDIQHLWVVPKRATRDANIGDVYGIGLRDEDEDTDDEGLDRPAEVASSSSSDLPSPPAIVSMSSNRASQLMFMYEVDEAVVKAMDRGSMHEWTRIEFKAICRRHGLSV